MPGLIPASTACDPPAAASLYATCDRMIREQIPNLFRLYLNPHVAQACYCLTRLVDQQWPGTAPEDRQVFLANSGEEALSGAIKLARYAANQFRRSTTGLLIGHADIYEHFAHSLLPDGTRIDYIPDVLPCHDASSFRDWTAHVERPPAFVVLPAVELRQHQHVLATLRRTPGSEPPALIALAKPALLDQDRQSAACGAAPLIPDIIVFDDAWTNREVPFGAFVASRRLFDHWNRRGMATFHSTTYQPNSIASLQFVKCLRDRFPEFIARHAAALTHLAHDFGACRATFGGLYSRSLARVISLTGFDGPDVTAGGHFVQVGDRRVFDGVAGVACSVRGHNPTSYLKELDLLDETSVCREELRRRLHALTGLPHVLPAVSGASAVEQALKLALISQSPRNHVLALRGGFGGKTLFALTATWMQSLRAGLDPLYPHVSYVDPFAPDALAALEAAFSEHPIGVVQLELIQGVGGVRAVPQPVLDKLTELRRRHDCLLFVDEVQTGMFRTGPLTRSRELGLDPDLLTLGKGTSDMMFPCALTLYSDPIQQGLQSNACTLPAQIVERHGYDYTYRTIVGTLRRAETENLADSVRTKGDLFQRFLSKELRSCPAVRDVRCFGLLIGIELRVPSRPLRKLLPQLYLLEMLRHTRFPLLVGFCQYEPHVLKLTPPLSVTEDEIGAICSTIADVLHGSRLRLAWSGLRQAVIQPPLKRMHRTLKGLTAT